MSRGPGIWQRKILEQLDEHMLVILTHPDHTKAEQNAIRRAASTLADKGLVEISAVNVGGQPRLVACRPNLGAPQPRIVHGLDGKSYRRPPAQWQWRQLDPRNQVKAI